MDKIIDIIQSILLAIPRFLYRKVVGEAQQREGGRQDLRAIRDALIEAQKIETMEVATTPKWYATREATVRASGLASAGPDATLRGLARNYHDAHDALANNWTRATPEYHTRLRAAFDRTMERVAALIGDR
jgi:hypothetical protein